MDIIVVLSVKNQLRKADLRPLVLLIPYPSKKGANFESKEKIYKGTS